MYLHGIHNNQPLVHGIVGHIDDMVAHDALQVSFTKKTGGGTMLIDTGAQVSVLDLNFALWIELPETDSETMLRGAGGEELQSRQFTALLHLPAWNITVPATFASFDLNRSQQESDPHIIAIIGMDILSDYVLTIDGPNGSIRLSLPDAT